MVPGAFFNFTLQRWLFATVANIIDGSVVDNNGTVQQYHLSTADRSQRFTDHMGFDTPAVRQTSGFKAVGVDVTVVNRLNEGALTLSRAADRGSTTSKLQAPNVEIAVLQPGEFHRVASYEGDRLLVSGITPGGKFVSERWVVQFSNGVVQERHVTDESCAGM